jgi:hypothetical protein
MAPPLRFSLGSDVIQPSNYPSSIGLASVEPRSNYFASKTHYTSLARRIAAALRGGGRFVLVTGDPPANPQFLSRALGDVGGSGYAVIDIPCGPALKGEDLECAVRRLAGPRASGGNAAQPECPTPASPLFVFEDIDQLSDRQIKEVYEGTLQADQIRAAGVLLAPPDFLARLERTALHFLKERLAAHYRVEEVGDDEAIPFLHNQLLAQRDRRAEARGFRHGILIGLTACGVTIAASIAAFFILHPSAEQVREAPASTQESSSSEPASMLPPPETAAPSAVPPQGAEETEPTVVSTPERLPLSAITASAPAKAESLPPIAPSAVSPPSVGPRLSVTEIDALMARGDAFFRAGDLTSARLYYERAADAGDGHAALQLGASFDPVILGLVGARGVTGDPAQALSWYRRAQQLGMAEAEQRIKSLETRPLSEADTRSR